MMVENQNEAEVRRLLDTWVDAAHEKDVAGLMACYAPSVVAFDLMPPLEITGADAYKKNWELAFSMSEGPFGVELRDLEISASDDVAFAHALEHITTTSTDGKPVDFWLRMTADFRRIDGAWKIVHEHTSVPIEMSTEKPLFDLEP